VSGHEPATAPGKAGESEHAALVEAMVAELTAVGRVQRCAAVSNLIRRDVSMAQMHVLWMLEHHGAMPMTRLAELLDVSLSNATGLIDRMEERGLITRTRTDEDRRRVYVQPDAGGRLALEQAEGLKQDRLRGVASRLDARQLRRAIQAFRDFRGALLAEGGTGIEHPHYFTDDQR
jgi:DNA-binding MarR family transcriptional regulator